MEETTTSIGKTELQVLKDIHIGKCVIVKEDYSINSLKTTHRPGDYIVIDDVLPEYKEHKEFVFQLSDGTFAKKSSLDNNSSNYLKYQ